MRYIYLIIALVVTASAASAQEYSTKNKRAIQAYEDGINDYQYDKFASAAMKFESAIRFDNNFIEAYFMLSEIYRDLQDYPRQVEYISQAVTIDSTFYVTAYYNAAIALMNQARFEEALKWLQDYEKFTPANKRRPGYKKQMQRANDAMQLLKHPVDYKPQIVNGKRRSPFDEYWPSLTLDGNDLVYTCLVPRDTIAFQNYPTMQKNSRNYHEDFYVIHKTGDNQWTSPEPLYTLNTDQNEGAQTLSADGKWMFFTACNWPDSRGSCDIYFSRLTQRGWTKPANVGAPVNTESWESQPCFSADGQTLYFVSKRQGGKGDVDIWKASIIGFNANGVPKFGNCENLGDSINTPGQESTPFIHPDNKTLYFSSDGWATVGGLDILVARRDNDKAPWHKPQNIGYPINTPLDDNGLIVDAQGKTAYLNSQQQTNDGRFVSTLLTFTLPEQSRPESVAYIKGNVYDSKTKHPLSAEIQLIRLEDNQLITVAQTDNVDGSFIVNLPTGKDYAFIAQATGYLLGSKNFSMPTTNYSIDLALQAIEVGSTMELRNIFFDTNSSTLKPESFVELDRLVQLLNDNPNMNIEIGGHTDNVGSADYNKKLSIARAKATVDYLIAHGANQARITYKGYGMTQPVATNDTEEGRATNRRIEAKVVGPTQNSSNNPK